MGERQFWHMQLFPGSYSGDNEMMEKCTRNVLKEKVIGLGVGWSGELSEEEKQRISELRDKSFKEYTPDDWGFLRKVKGLSPSANMIENFYKEMHIGDIVLVHAGQKPIALVEVKTDYYFSLDKSDEERECEEGKIWFLHRRDIEILKEWPEDTDEIFPNPRGTLMRVRDETTDSYKFILKHLKEVFSHKKGGEIVGERQFWLVYLHPGEDFKPEYYKTAVEKGIIGTWAGWYIENCQFYDEVERDKNRLLKPFCYELKKGDIVLVNKKFDGTWFQAIFEVVDDKVYICEESLPDCKELSGNIEESIRECLKKRTVKDLTKCLWVKHGLIDESFELQEYQGDNDNGHIWFDVIRKVKVLWHKESEDTEFKKENGEGFSSMSTISKIQNQAVKEKIMEKIKEHLIEEKTQEIIDLMEKTEIKQIILYGPPGSGKTYLARKVAEVMTGEKEAGDKSKLIQFHPSYTYEDFVAGIQVSTEEGKPVYETKGKIFAEMCKEAQREPDKKFVLIIDEINRANLPVVLGELIYALEYRGDKGEVEIPYEIDGSRKLKVPENLYLIGTMNTADRSIGHIDYAIRRRFLFYPVKAEKDLIDHPSAQRLYERVIEKIFTKENLSPEFKDKVEDVKIGHTYFLGKDEEYIAYKFVYQVIPLLKEYVQDGILKNEEGIQEAFKEFFGGGTNWKKITVEQVKEKLK